MPVLLGNEITEKKNRIQEKLMQKFSTINRNDHRITVLLDEELIRRAGFQIGDDVIIEALDGCITITPVFCDRMETETQ